MLTTVEIKWINIFWFTIFVLFCFNNKTRVWFLLGKDKHLRFDWRGVFSSKVFIFTPNEKKKNASRLRDFFFIIIRFLSFPLFSFFFSPSLSFSLFFSLLVSFFSKRSSNNLTDNLLKDPIIKSQLTFRTNSLVHVHGN